MPFDTGKTKKHADGYDLIDFEYGSGYILFALDNIKRIDCTDKFLRIDSQIFKAEEFPELVANFPRVFGEIREEICRVKDTGYQGIFIFDLTPKTSS